MKRSLINFLMVAVFIFPHGIMSMADVDIADADVAMDVSNSCSDDSTRLLTHHSHLVIPKNSTEIKCQLKPIRRESNRGVTHPHIPLTDGTSQNWSGYVAATNLSKPVKNSVNDVFGTWTVPTLSAATHTTYCAIWVGIDGFSNGTVEQCGTEHEWVNGKQQNYAWFEMYPASSYEISNFPVNPGDSISASVEYVGNNKFSLIMVNNTRNVHTVVPTSYTTSTTAQRASAEWVVEAPYSNTILPLSHFGKVTMTNCTATINGVQGGINNTKWQEEFLEMVTNTGVAKAIPSALSSNGETFSVTWAHE